jgi:type III restriction enzyme
VKALPERKHLEITFPRVEGYIFDARHRIKADIEKIPILMVEPSRAPTEVIVKDAVGYRLGRPDRLGPGHEVVQDRDVYHVIQRPQGIEYQLAARVTNYLQHDARRFLFPQVLNIVREFLAQRVKTTSEAPLEEVSLLRYADEIVSRLCAAIEPDTEAGEPPLLPIIERFRPKGSTSEVLFRTVKTCYGTTKSHVSHVVADSPGWEHSVAYQLERSLSVIAYVKNDHLDFVIPYEYEGVQHDYRPDFIVRLRLGNGQEENLILEVKGFEREQDRAKETAARRWVKAVNYHAGFGNWAWAVARDPKDIINILEGTGKKSQ